MGFSFNNLLFNLGILYILVNLVYIIFYRRKVSEIVLIILVLGNKIDIWEG